MREIQICREKSRKITIDGKKKKKKDEKKERKKT